MQAAEMMRSTRTVCSLAFLIFLSSPYVHSFPLQILPSIPGYIPVYIRHGDQPLEEINPALAEAFHEGSSLSENSNPVEDEANKYNVSPVHVKEASNPFTVDSEESRKAIEEAVETKASESATNIEQKSRREKHRRKFNRKPAVSKVHLSPEEEKEMREKLRTAVESERKISKNTQDAYMHLYESSPHKSDYKRYVRYPIPVSLNHHQRIITNDLRSSPLTSEELPIKEQLLPDILPNVQNIFLPMKIPAKPEKEQTENQSLEMK
ncbi:PREDICTED: uncharacterized protein LOC108572135 [Habropoda laboriosa]|uniref:uncharacterized protein LOC108572135 n=1 Tax=Habropoda laboriosa TaxID=597456 RepID=UPI00083D3927|nr:PREDICTED: uncharacterized protein LOC108572135 [Habropoda laboriosa]